MVSAHTARKAGHQPTLKHYAATGCILGKTSVARRKKHNQSQSAIATSGVSTPTKAGASNRQNAQMTAAHWSGPLPPPSALHSFNEVIPGGADRILKMAESEQAHRHRCDGNALQLEIEAVKRGQWLGATVSIMSIIGATVSTLVHAPWQATAALVGVPILGIIQSITRRSGKS
jgi:uncharacterized membrane protein